MVNPPNSRTCGTCYACCIHLGIAELQKYPGQSCKHLDGTNPTRRCSIYPSRPGACSRYICGWIEGLGDDEFRPDKSGILVTTYPGEEGERFSITIIIINPLLSGDLTTNPLARVLSSLLTLDPENIRILNYHTKSGFFVRGGNINKIKILRAKTHEGLVFEIIDPPIAHYKSFTSAAEAAKWGKENLPSMGIRRVFMQGD